MRRTAVAVALGAVSALALGSAAPIRGTAAPAGGTLRVALPAGFTPVLDPAYQAGTVGWGALWYATCATLFAFRDAPAPAGFTVRPEAALGPPVISADGRTYVFTVRQGLRFSDGSRLAADNFRYALDRVRNPTMGSEGAFVFSDVKRVTASGRRLRIELIKRSGDLLTRLALSFACPVPLDFPIDPVGRLLDVGSGPYYVERYEVGRLIVLERNRYYRGGRPHWVDRVEITSGGDSDAAIRAVEEGRADVYGAELPFEVRDRLAQAYLKSRLFPLRGTFDYFIALNMSQPLFRGNLPLRKAVNLALDRTEIAKTGPGWPRSHPPTDQIIPRWVPGWAEHRIYPLDGPDLPRAGSLAAGNLRGGKAVLWVDQTPSWLVDQARVVARQLSQISLEVAVRPLARSFIQETAGRPGAQYDMLLTRYLLLYPDPADVVIRLLAGKNARRTAGNTNLAYFDSRAYNRKMADADRLGGAARMRAFSALDAEIMRGAAPWAPLYEGTNWLFVSERVGCVKPHPVFRVDFAGMCLQ